METIKYAATEDYRNKFAQHIQTIIETKGLQRVCDIGGGANPVLTPDEIHQHQLDYVLLDISSAELAKAPEQYSKLQADICAENLPVAQPFDLAFSIMLVEHIRDASRLHSNIWKLLCPGGVAVHFFPTLFTLPFLVNFLLPEKLTSFFMDIIDPRDRYQFEKFPAYYDWCFGPVERQIERFRSVGFEVESYVGCFGHAGYYDRIQLIKRMHHRKTAFLLQYPNPWLTSYAFVVLQKT